MPPRIPLVTRKEQEDQNNRHFNRTPSAAYKQVVKAIIDLAKSEGWDDAERAIAEAVGLNYLHEYEERHDVRQGKNGGSGGLARLAGTDIDWGLPFPSGDHADLWMRDGKVARASEQPYGPIDDRQLREMLGFCEKHGLRMSISARSYHFAGRTLMIDLVREDEKLMP